MAELPGELSEEILRVFLKAYNARRATKFCLDHKLAESNDSSCDYHFVDPGDGELKIQVTTPHGDEDLRKANARDSYFFGKLDTEIKESGIEGVAAVGITLSATPLPFKRKCLDRLVSELLTVIHSEVLHACQNEARLSPRDLCDRSKLLGRYFSSLRFKPGGEPAKPPCLILSPYKAILVQDPVTHVGQTYLRKSGRYGSSAHDLILLIYAGTIPYDDDQLKRMVSTLKKETSILREVWTFCAANSTGWRVDCVKE
jgi:hypothetical protein